MQVQLIVVAGFLGSGKTTLIMQAAQHLQRRGLRVGVITNDQAGDLVDTAMVRQAQLPVVEVVGGCFCCRFPDLWQAVETLMQEVNPHVILAEPVGSCTDLAATIVRPMRRYHAEHVRVAPLTVLVDATRSWQAAPAAVQYLHEQQLREAEVVLVSKADVLSPAQQQYALHSWRQRCPHADVRLHSSGDSLALMSWLARVEMAPGNPRVLTDIDYTAYADAEAALAWLNATVQLQSTRPFSVQVWMAAAVHQLNNLLQQYDAWLAHVKMHVETTHGVAKLSLLTGDAPLTWDQQPPESAVWQARVTLNARVVTTPGILREVWQTWLVLMPRHIHPQVVQCDVFAPDAPQPTYCLREDSDDGEVNA